MSKHTSASPLSPFASAARTATPTPFAFTNNGNANGVVLALNVTAASGTGGLTVHLQFLDPNTNAVTDLFVAPRAVTAPGLYTYTFGPTVGFNNLIDFGGWLPIGHLQVQVVHGDASSYTYSVSGFMLGNNSAEV
jgi:hypothetical protein